MKRIMSAPNLPEAQGAYCMATIANGFVFVSGQGPYDPESGEFQANASVADQTRFTIECIKLVLAEAGAALEDVVSARVFLKDIDDFAEMNGVYAEYFGDIKPARTTVQSTPPIGISVEIDCIAVAPS